MKKPGKKNGKYAAKQVQPDRRKQWITFLSHCGRFLMLAVALFAVELYAFLILKPADPIVLLFGALWSVLLASIFFAIPRKVSRILFGIVHWIMILWTVAQSCYHLIFGKLMWISTTRFAGEGAEFMGSLLPALTPMVWICALLLFAIGVLVLVFYPKIPEIRYGRLWLLVSATACIIGLSVLPEAVFVKDNDVWGTHSEYAQSSSLRANYKTMYDAKNVYHICGIYHLSFRDLWVNCLYPLTPAYQITVNEQVGEVDDFFEQRQPHEANEMTGIFQGKNVVFVLMESMDDWMITPEDTPTLCRLMDEGIQFTEFYTPGYGSARTINSEFCMNTGIYLPTTGKYVFDYVTNDFSQSIAGQLNAAGYTSEVFHYNTHEFYSRGVFEPAMGYDGYNSYMDYTQQKNDLYSDQYLFDNPTLNQLFFRDGQTYNMIITRSAHGSYIYREVLSYYAMGLYPQYRGRYGSEEENCARVKAKLVDDLFARLLQELQRNGQLENTVIVAMTDHYTYLYSDTDEVLELSGLNQDTALLLEKTPCFIWSADCPSVQVDKTLNTADLLPTVLNLMGIEPPWQYLGQDAFDPNYAGYCIFPDGSWISDGLVYQSGKVILNPKNKEYSQEYLQEMNETAQKFVHVNNLLLTSDYYQEVQ